MPERFGMFDSTPEDPREYSMEDFSRFFTMFLTSGIFNGGTNLKVFCDGNNINTKIDLGRGWIQGYAYEVYDNPIVLQHELPDISMDRIDRVVLRLDKTLEHRYLKAFILKGAPANKPTPPTLTRSDNIWEISLAQVKIIKGKSYIEGWQITDERLDNSVCGLVNSLIQADTKTIFDQFQLWYNAKTKEYDENWNLWTSKKTIEFNNWINANKTEYEDKTTEFIKLWNDWYGTKTPTLEKQFNDWFNSIKKQLDGNIAASLQEQINEVKSSLADKANKVIKDDATPKKYELGIKNGLLYYREVL